MKPLTTATPAEERRTEGRSVLATGLEKLKSTIHAGRSSQLSEQETERKKVQALMLQQGSLIVSTVKGHDTRITLLAHFIYIYTEEDLCVTDNNKILALATSLLS